jgi:hypothetical protein
MRVIFRSVFSQIVGRADDGVLDHLQRDTAGGHDRLSTGFEHTQGFGHSIAAFGRDGALAGEGCVRSILGIQIIVFAALAAIMRIRCGDLQNFDASVLHVTQQPRAIGARRLDADPLQRSERAHPGKHLLVAMPGCRKASACQYPIELVDDGSDMKIFVCIEAADDTTATV